MNVDRMVRRVWKSCAPIDEGLIEYVAISYILPSSDWEDVCLLWLVDNHQCKDFGQQLLGLWSLSGHILKVSSDVMLGSFPIFIENRLDEFLKNLRMGMRERERERESRLVSLAQCESCCHKGPRIIQSAGESAWLWLFFSSKELENPHLFWSCYSCPREQWFYCQTCFELFKTKKLLNQRIGPKNFSCKQHGYLHWLAQSWLVITTGGRTWSSAQSPEKRRTFHFLLGRASFGCPLFFIFIFTFFYFYFWEISKKKNFFFKIQLRILQSNGRIGSWVA